jgi:signal transduction histidine kinase
MDVTVKRPNILIVEDEIIIARDIQAQLVGMGYAVAGHVVSGQEAVASADALRPDLVLMDIQLAGSMDGIVAAQAIRDQFFIPVVFLSAFAADAIIARAKLTEPYGYILKPFSERELHTVIEMALYKHQAESKLRENARQLRALSRRVLEAQETERRRVAVELHDEIGQSLTAVKINLQAHQRFKEQTSEQLNAENLCIVEAALQQVRRLALALRPSMLDDLGLVPALRWTAEQAAARSGFSVTVLAQENETQERLSSELEIVCYRIVQEALTNIARHANAQQVVIELRNDAAVLTLTVQDDGGGFDPAATHRQALGGESLGVLGMKERAHLIGGELSIESQPAKGCTVLLRCPLRFAESVA